MSEYTTRPPPPDVTREYRRLARDEAHAVSDFGDLGPYTNAALATISAACIRPRWRVALDMIALRSP